MNEEHVIGLSRAADRAARAIAAGVLEQIGAMPTNEGERMAVQARVSELLRVKP